MTKQLTKESLFAYRVMQRAAAKAGMYVDNSSGKDENIIVAGGAIRDLYFNREIRDLDVYYNSDIIKADRFATAFKQIDANKLAREFGFDSVEIVRLSDNSKMGTGGDGDGEDWGDVDDAAKASIHLFVSYIQQYMNLNGDSFHDATMKANLAVPSVRQLFALSSNRSAYKYTQHLLGKLGIANVNSKQTNSASGNKVGKAHPLQSIEEFEFIFNGDRWGSLHVELMAVDQRPIAYVNKHFAVKLSRAYFDGHGIHFTPDFMQDARNKTITVACPIEHARFERLFSYYLPKMKNYFPDFEIRVDLDAMNQSHW